MSLQFGVAFARLRVLLLAGLLALCAGCTGFASSAPVDKAQISSWQAAPLVVQTAHGDVSFQVEIAADADTQRRGLMYRESLASDAGMLFLFGMDDQRAFWMENTLIPLDMIFIQADGKIVAIVENTEPKSTGLISPVQFAASVLEINGGQSRARGLEVGNMVKHPALTAFSQGAP